MMVVIYENSKKIQKIIQGLNLNRFANNKITAYVLKKRGVLFIKIILRIKRSIIILIKIYLINNLIICSIQSQDQ